MKTLSALLVGLIAGPLAAGEKTNVILIVADDLGWADLRCYGSKYHQTPNLDRLAASGARFTQAYSACPVCSPSRAAILTGCYPQRFNITDWLPGRADRADQKLMKPTINQQLPAHTPTIASMMKQAGYATAHIGKWHLGGKDAAPQHFGFDLNIGGDYAGSPRSYFSPFKNAKGEFMPGLEQAPEGEYLTDRLNEAAVNFIDANRDKPFFLYLAHYAPHIPLKAKDPLIAKYKAGQPGQQGNPIYAAMLESLDEGIGAILKKLDELKLSERTLVIFTSDNGGLCTLEGPNTPPTINAPLREGKGFLYEGGIRVPLIMRWPGKSKPGSINDAPVCGIDLTPTMLEACGVTNAAKCDGVSLASVLEGQKMSREYLYWHYPHYSNQGGRPGGAMRWRDWKYIEFYETDRRELFHLKDDPGEAKNVAAAFPKMIDELAADFEKWRKEVGAKMMKPNPQYVPNPQASDGSITLPARTAEIHGRQLRYEPLPHKNTLGYWIVAEDWASWEFTVAKSGKFSVEILQGCGKGQGGSEVEVAIGDQKLNFVVEDTGHFQNFKAREIGNVALYRQGTFTLEIRPKKKAAAAVMDVREVRLKPSR